jgi:hypothetical protein
VKRIDRCFLAKGGILVVLEPPDGGTFNVKKLSAHLRVEEDGLVLFLGECWIPLPEDIFDYITENRIVTIYEVDVSRYANPPTVTIELDKDILIEAKAIYRYHKSRTHEGLGVTGLSTSPSTNS